MNRILIFIPAATPDVAIQEVDDLGKNIRQMGRHDARWMGACKVEHPLDDHGDAFDLCRDDAQVAFGFGVVRVGTARTCPTPRSST